MRNYYSYLLLALLACNFVTTAHSDEVKDGQQITMANCAGCHTPGVMGAPKIGSKSDWEQRFEQGFDVLLNHALEGFNNMPKRGGNILLEDAEVKAAVEYMLQSAGLMGGAEAPAVEDDSTAAEKSVAQPKDKKLEEPTTVASVTSNSAVSKQLNGTTVSRANRFNRLMKSKEDWNPPPIEDGIHDPEDPEVEFLQSPREAFEGFKENPFGNHVDWVDVLTKGQISPRYDLIDPDKQPIVMDLNIVREVKGSMPDVVYPHKQHTEWLDCSNCHPAIFIPQKGANALSMASILMGQQCGVCHGKVAFPVSECRRCHSKPKARK
jgi:c(7)-type cytochrome triheme protein